MVATDITIQVVLCNFLIDFVLKMKDNSSTRPRGKAEKGNSGPKKSEQSPKKHFDKKASFDKKKPGYANNKGGKPGKQGSSKDSVHKGAKRSFTSSTGATAQKMDLIASLKTDWNKVRVKTMKTEDRNALMKKMADRVRGRILQVHNHHTT